jgi:anthranilate synthase component 1
MLIQTADPIDRDQSSVLVPVVRSLPADLETPVSVYLKLAGEGPSFLLESVTGGEQLARYSFIGVAPKSAYVLRAGVMQSHDLDLGQVAFSKTQDQDPLSALRDIVSRHPYQPVPGMPRFPGGLVGYLGYDTVRFFEPAVSLISQSELPDAIFLLADTLVAFDHAYGRLLLITNAHLDADGSPEREQAEARLDALQERLTAPLPRQSLPEVPERDAELRSNFTRDQFIAAVQKAKDYIAAGDIFQAVLSQRLSRDTTADPFSIYRSLRRLNPSPYMYFFDFGELVGTPALQLIGASPEMHVRLQGRQATLRPIAGTRPRGQTPGEDLDMERDLLADAKERAEHIMLVDLARNDLGRVCGYGSVKVPELMGIERYSHVMHIVSQVEGELRPEFDAFDLMRATFPAGTVSGAPKIRAMQIIRELEAAPRGPYAGAVGYFAYDGSMDTCITIRTLVMRGGTISVQAGAGIVADSDPESEFQETLNKARALAVAVELAEGKVRPK